MAEEDTTLLAPDNLHPSAKMYSMWVEEMLPTITEILDE
jgi:lysophospholipase L1-like esterase